MNGRESLVSLALLSITLGCATAPSSEEIAANAAAMLKSSFKANGQASLDRLNQDETQALCSQLAGKPPSKEVAARIEKINRDAIKYPADGKLLGDWKNGEKIAQEGRGKQFSDDPAGPVGANCYACHQLAPQARSVPASINSENCADTARTHNATRTERSTIPRPTRLARTCRVSATAVFSTSSSSRTSPRC